VKIKSLVLFEEIAELEVFDSKEAFPVVVGKQLHVYVSSFNDLKHLAISILL